MSDLTNTTPSVVTRDPGTARELLESWQEEVRQADAALEEIEQASAAFREHAEDRLETLANRIADVRRVLVEGQEAVQSQVDDSLAEAGALAEGQTTRLQTSSAALNALEAELVAFSESARTRCEETRARSEECLERFVALDTDVREKLGEALVLTEAAVIEQAHKQARDIGEWSAQFESTGETAVGDFIAHGLAQHQVSLSNRIEQFADQVGNCGSSLEANIRQSMASFSGLIGSEVSQLASDIDDTERSVRRLCDDLSWTIKDFSTLGEGVTTALSHTQVGLRAVVGSLEKAKRILEEVEVL
jgi:DNA repair exonuclease SbcCD ATPase subunit